MDNYDVTIPHHSHKLMKKLCLFSHIRNHILHHSSGVESATFNRGNTDNKLDTVYEQNCDCFIFNCSGARAVINSILQGQITCKTAAILPITLN